MEELGFAPFFLIKRTAMESLPRPVALLTLDEIQAASLIAELPRMGNDDYVKLLHKQPRIRWELVAFKEV